MNLPDLHDTAALPQFLEAVMLVCFGVAWPCASLRLLRTRRAQSNGLVFTLVILCGYLFGASSKIVMALRGTELAPVFWLYAANALSVAVNLGLQLHFGRCRASRGEAPPPFEASGSARSLAPADDAITASIASDAAPHRRNSGLARCPDRRASGCHRLPAPS